jgi:hypothetical protein
VCMPFQVFCENLLYIFKGFFCCLFYHN